MRRAVLVDVADAAVLVAALGDLLRRTNRQPTARLVAVLKRLNRSICDASGPKSVTMFAPEPDSRQHSACDLCTTAEAGKILGISPHAVRALVRRGRLPAHTTGSRWLLPIRTVVIRAERQASKRG
jgi:excisionase family DNA binding protein